MLFLSSMAPHGTCEVPLSSETGGAKRATGKSVEGRRGRTEKDEEWGSLCSISK